MIATFWERGFQDDQGCQIRRSTVWYKDASSGSGKARATNKPSTPNVVRKPMKVWNLLPPRPWYQSSVAPVGAQWPTVTLSSYQCLMFHPICKTCANHHESSRPGPTCYCHWSAPTWNKNCALIETVSLFSMGRCEDSRSHLNNLNTAPLKASPMGAPRSSRPRSPGNATKLVKLEMWVEEKHCQPISQ